MSQARAQDAGGRPRSEAARRKIHAAARAELSDKGFRAVSVESIAKRAQAGKATIYRWWPTKAALLLDALNGAERRYPEFDRSLPARQALRTEIRDVIAYFSTPEGAAFLDLMAESRFDRSLAAVMSDEFVQGRRAASAAILREVLDTSGRRDADLDAAMDLLWGSVYYQFLVLGHVPDDAYVDKLLAIVAPEPGAKSATEQ